MTLLRIAFYASKRPEAQQVLPLLRDKYGHFSEEEAEVIVALGGDGAMLDTLRRRFDDGKPVYGMHRGTVGFAPRSIPGAVDRPSTKYERRGERLGHLVRDVWVTRRLPS